MEVRDVSSCSSGTSTKASGGSHDARVEGTPYTGSRRARTRSGGDRNRIGPRRGLSAGPMFNWDAAQVSPGAEPARRWRLRKQLGRTVITFNVPPHLTDKLVRLGWLDATERQPGSARGLDTCWPVLMPEESSGSGQKHARAGKAQTTSLDPGPLTRQHQSTRDQTMYHRAEKCQRSIRSGRRQQSGRGRARRGNPR